MTLSTLFSVRGEEGRGTVKFDATPQAVASASSQNLHHGDGSYSRPSSPSPLQKIVCQIIVVIFTIRL